MKNKLILLLVLIAGFGMQNAQAALRRVLPVVKSTVSHAGFAAAPRRVFPTTAKFVAGKAPKASWLKANKMLVFGATATAAVVGKVYFELNEMFEDRIVELEAEPFDTIEYDWLYEMIEQLSDQADIPMPRILRVPDNEILFMACAGTDAEHTAIVISQGALNLLRDGELEVPEFRAILAHELAHIKNKDDLSCMVVVAGGKVGSGIYCGNIVYKACKNLIMPGLSSVRLPGRIGKLIGVAGAAVCIMSGQNLVYLAHSRFQEYAADEVGAKTCKDPLALASGLQKLGKHFGGDRSAPTSTTDLILDAIDDMTRTHPERSKRIARLQAMATKMEAAK